MLLSQEIANNIIKDMTEFNVNKTRINNSTIKYQFIKPDNSKLTYGEFINLLQSKDKEFIKEFDRQLSQAPAELSQQPTAYFWECVPASRDTVNREFEFVVVKSEALEDISQDLSSFSQHFRGSSDNHVVSFPSLSGDTLVVPMPVRGYQYSCNDYSDEARDYKNLKEFNNNASLEQKEHFWQKVGEKMAESLNNTDAPRWLSTSGLGVSYLHVRIDSRPKYYTHDEYRSFQVQFQQASQQSWQQQSYPYWQKR